MAMAALHLLRRNTGRIPSFCSFPLFPSRILECQSTTAAGLNIIKCFHQQKYKWSKGAGGIPPTPTPTPSQLTNIQAYLLIPSQSIKQMVQGIRGYTDFNSFHKNLYNSRPKLYNDNKRKHPNDGRTDKKKQKLEAVVQSEVVQSEACTTTTITTTISDHHLSNSVNIGQEIMGEIMGDGEYVVKITRRRSSTGGSSSTHDEEADEEAVQMAQNADMLILHGELLQDMGKELLSQTQASLPSI